MQAMERVRSMKGDAYSTWWARLGGILLAAAVSMTALEFVEVQKLSSDELRTRFGLPLSCDPVVTAPRLIRP